MLVATPRGVHAVNPASGLAVAIKSRTNLFARVAAVPDLPVHGDASGALGMLMLSLWGPLDFGAKSDGSNRQQ